MFDGRSCVGPMWYSSSCQAVNKWSYMNYFDIENGKSSLEVDENDAPRQPDINVRNGKRPLEVNLEENESQQRKCTRMLGSSQKGDPAGILFEQKVYEVKDPLDSSVISQMDQDSNTIQEQNKSCQLLNNSRRVEESKAWSDDGLSNELQQHLAGVLSGDHHSSELQHHYGESSDSSDQKSDEQQLKDQEYAEDLLKFSDQQSNEEQQNHGGDSSYSGSLLPRMNQDSSITCLSHCSRSDYGAVALLNRSFRELVRSGELYKWRRINGIIEHWIYFSCALLEWEAYDPIRQRWMHLPRMASNECFMCSDKESLAVGTELLVFGRELTSHVIYRYSLLTNSWTSGVRMNDPRCLFGSASLGEVAILAGGCDSAGRILSSAELYNSETQTWEPLPRMNKPRKMCSGVFMDGKFYVIGGIGGSESKLLTCGEEYNLQTRAWTEIPNMSPGRCSRGTEMPATAEAPPLVAVVDNELYAADYADMEVKKYDKNRKEWNTIGRLPERAVSMNGWGLAFRACGDRLIVIGGARTSGEGFIELNSWVPREGPPQWNLLARKRSGNFVYNCAVMGC